MVYELFTFKGLDIKVDGFLKRKLDIALKMQDKDFDVVFIIDGKEGTGKSTLGHGVAWYLSKGNFTMDHICEGSSDAVEKLGNLPNKSVMIIDEGSLLFSSKDAMRNEQKQLIKILNVIRQKNMILIIIAPSFFELIKYISVDRGRFLLHVYTRKNYARGAYTYFSEKKKRMLYQIGKKNFNSYAKPRSDFIGSFPKFELPFHDEYMVAKRKALMEAMKITKVLSPLEVETSYRREKIRKMINNGRELSNSQLAYLFGLSKSTIDRDILALKPTSAP